MHSLRRCTSWCLHRDREGEGERKLSDEEQVRVRSLRTQAWGLRKCMESAYEEGKATKQRAAREARESQSFLLEAKIVVGVAETHRCCVEAMMVMRGRIVREILGIKSKVGAGWKRGDGTALWTP